MAETITIGEAARLLDVPRHQAQRTADQIWPDLPRIARARVMQRHQLCELAAAIQQRFGNREVSR